MKLMVKDKVLVAADTMRVRLAGTEGEPLPGFSPGAHIGITLGSLQRRYSLTSSPLDLLGYEITVLRTDPSSGGSVYLHDQLAVGDEAHVDGPHDAFPVDLEAEHSVFIAGGIGITPFMTMTAALDRAGRSYEVHHAARDESRFPPVPDMGNVRRYVDRDGRPGLDVAGLLDGLNRTATLYVCGPRPLIEAVRLGAMERGWPDARVRFESFGVAPKPTDRPVTVVLAQSGMELTVDPGTAILDAMLDAGVWAPFECRRGECGSCHVGVREGEPDHRDVCLTSEQRDAGLCTCVSWATSDTLVLEL